MILKLATMNRRSLNISNAIALNPTNEDAYYWRGMCYGKTGYYINDIADQTKAIELATKASDPLSASEAYDQRAKAYGSVGNYDQEVADETSAIGIYPSGEWAYSTRAMAYYQLKQYDNAIADCNKDLELDPNMNSNAYQVRGYAYGGLGNYDQEIADETTAIGINPSNGWSYVARAQAYYQLHQYDNAWDDVHKAQSLGITVYPDLINDLNNATGNDTTGGAK